MEEFKERQRAVWEAGDYASVSENISDVGELLVERAGVGADMAVLDVACGAGNATIPAARTGARVTGLDLTPSLLEAGRKKAEAAGLGIEWVDGDAEELPFDDGSFDRVLSTFGHMFAPRHQRTADEMARVCREGGAIAFCAWLPDGTVGEMFKTSTKYMPPPPDFAEPPLLWGREEHVRERFASVAKDFTFERHTNYVEAESVEAWADFFTSRFGPLVTAQQILGDRWPELRAETVALWERGNEATGGGFRFPQQYLLSIVRL